MKKKNSPLSDTLFLALGELVVSLAIVGVYLILNKFSYRVVTGALLGSAVTIFNYFFLSVSVNRAVDKVMALKGDSELSEEEAQAFAAKHQATVQHSVRFSYIMRQVLMLAVLVAAFLLDWFDVIATLIPLLMFRPLLMVGELLQKRGQN